MTRTIQFKTHLILVDYRHRGDDDDDDDAYEEPMPTPPNKGKSHIPASKELEEIKVLLQEKEVVSSSLAQNQQ